MKFMTDSLTRCTPRTGKLTEFERIPDTIVETPLLLMYTKRGCVPHLTKDIIKTITCENQVISVSLSSTLNMMESIKDIGVSLAEFISMKEHINVLSIHDTSETTNSGFQQLDAISVWSRTGRYLLTADKYMDIVEAFVPDLYVALCDGDTNYSSSNKRTVKAVNRSKTLLEQCLQRHFASEKLKSKGILGAVEGGYNLKAREYSVDYLKDKPLIGYVIDGLHNNGPNVKDIPWEQIKPIIQYTINLLPTEKLRVSFGCWHPLIILELINLGVDVFDSTYSYLATETSEALTFMCDHRSCQNVFDVLTIPEKRYKDDFFPICNNCTCLTCRNHSRAYLHHLHHTKEMLEKVLLMIHNTHHYLDFFQAIRQNIKNNTFQQFKEKMYFKFVHRNA